MLLRRLESPRQTAAHHTGPAAFLTPITEASTKSDFQDDMMVDNYGAGEMTWPLASMNMNSMASNNNAESSGREPALSTYGAAQRCKTDPRKSQGTRSCFDGEFGDLTGLVFQSDFTHELWFWPLVYPTFSDCISQYETAYFVNEIILKLPFLQMTAVEEIHWDIC